MEFHWDLLYDDLDPPAGSSFSFWEWKASQNDDLLFEK